MDFVRDFNRFMRGKFVKYYQSAKVISTVLVDLLIADFLTVTFDSTINHTSYKSHMVEHVSV